MPKGSVFALSALLVLCSGCFTSSAPDDVRTWTIVHNAGGSGRTVSMEGTGRPMFATTRLGPLTVAAPYDRSQFVLQREDGSIAIDHYNVFAAPPAVLLRTPMRDNLAEFPKFGHVVLQSSVASSDVQVEVFVSNLSLRSPSEGRPLAAHAKVTVDLVRTGRGPRSVICSVTAEDSCDVVSGNYTTAFSAAFDRAVRQALEKAEEPRGESGGAK